MQKIKKYLSNGGKRELLRIIPQFILYVIIGIFILGKYVKGSVDDRSSIKARISIIEQRQDKTEDCLTKVLANQEGLKATQARILEILQGKYGK